MLPEEQNHRRVEIFRVHRNWHRDNFGIDGHWKGPLSRNGVDNAREWLWHAMAFLAGNEADIKLGNIIIRATPNVPNHFSSIAGIHILLRYSDQLENESVSRLRAIIFDSIAENVDYSLSITGLNNFSAMRAMFFLGAAQLFETYQVPYKMHSPVPEVYNCVRLRRFGVNLLRLIEAQFDRADLAEEFNSPTYSPLSLMAIAEIVNLIDYAPAIESAARIERRLWREMLAFHHPRLYHASGPYSRAYMVDSVGHGANWKILCAFLGIDGDTTVEQLLYPPQQGQVIHHDGDIPFQQCETCWHVLGEYHIPDDILEEFNTRAFPYSYQGSYEWSGFGFKTSDGRIILNVEGDYCTPGGKGIAGCYQTKKFSIGSMSESNTTHNHPCQIVYRLGEATGLPGTTRSVTTNMLTNAPSEFVTNELGDRIPPVMFANNGRFEITQDANTVSGTVQPYHWSAHYFNASIGQKQPGCDEISFNMFVSKHLHLERPVEKATLNGEVFTGQMLSADGDRAEFIIEDAAVKISCRLKASDAKLRLFHHGGFLRCSAVLYEGPPKMFTPEQLEKFTVEFSITVENRLQQE